MCLGSCVDQITELVKAIVGRSGSCFQALLRWPCTIYLLHTYKVLLVGSSDTTCNLSSERRLLVSVEEFSVATLLCLIAWLFIKLLCFSYIKKNPSSKPAKMCVCVCTERLWGFWGKKRGLLSASTWPDLDRPIEPTQPENGDSPVRQPSNAKGWQEDDGLAAKGAKSLEKHGSSKTCVTY